MAIHLFDGARAITGADPVSVYCESSNPPWSWYAGDAAADAIFTMTGGLRFAFTGNWAGDGFRTSWTGTWRATGERGSAIWEDEGAPRVSPARGERVEAVGAGAARAATPSASRGSSSRSPSSSTRSGPAASRPASATTTSARSRCATPPSSPRARGAGSRSRRNLVA